MSSEELAEGYTHLVRNLYKYDNFADRLINAVKLGGNPWTQRPDTNQ